MSVVHNLTPRLVCLWQEYFVEDMVDAFQFIGQITPQVLETAQLHEVIMCITALMGSTNYVKNPYLRSKLAEVCVGADMAVSLLTASW